VHRRVSTRYRRGIDERGGLAVDAVALVEAEVRDLVRDRGLDPLAEPAAMRGLVEEVVGEYGERGARDGRPMLGDGALVVREVLAAVTVVVASEIVLTL
jgi:hypothetical protein